MSTLVTSTDATSDQSRWHKVWRSINTGWETFWGWTPVWRTIYGAGNLVRWGLIFAMLIFLLSLIVSLYEAVNFQNRVASLASGQEGARRVLLELYDLKEEGRLQEDGGTLPLGAMAVKLDHVRAARDKLGQFSFKPKDGPTPDAGGQTSAAADATTEGAAQRGGDGDTSSVDVRELERQSEAALDELNGRLAELEYELQNQNGGIKIALGLTKLEDATNKLERFEFQPKDSSGQSNGKDASADSGDVEQPEVSASDDDPTLAYKATVDDLGDMIENVKVGVRLVEPQETFISTQLAQMQERAAALKDFYMAGSFKTRDDEPGLAPDSTQSQSPNQYPVAEMKTIVERMEKALRDHEDEFWVADQIARSINAMRGELEQLKSEQVTGFEAGNGSTEPRTESQNQGEFDSTLEGLSGAIRELEETFSERTPVATLASALAIDGNVPANLAASRAQTILLDYRSLDRFASILEPFEGLTWGIGSLGIDPQSVATLSTDSLRLVFIFVVGAIGSVLYITKRQMQLALQGHWLTHPPKRPLMWLIFRPFFGIVVALAVFLVVRAGQMALGGESGEIGSGASLNLPILAVIALFAGLLSWHAVDAIESKGKVWFQGQSRRDLWATGLDHALRDAGRSVDECANQIGRSVEQIERWLMFRDKVTPEMQDRISTWLERAIDEIFGDINDESINSTAPMWASGLRTALDDGSRKLDPTALAELIGESDPERVRKWTDLEMQVSPAMQWRLVDALSVPHRQLFDANQQKREAWASGLRAALEQRGGSVKGLADALQIDEQRVRDWMELKEAVPTNRQDQIAAELRLRHGRLFDYARPSLSYASHVRPFLKTRGIDEQRLADEIDVDVPRIKAWLDLEQPLAPATQRRIAAVVGVRPEDAFTAEPHAPPTRWAVGLAEALEDLELDQADQTFDQVDLAKAIEIDPAHMAKWFALQQPVPVTAERRIVKELRRRGLRRAKYQGLDHRQVADQLFGSRWATHLREQLSTKGKTEADLAQDIGADPAHVARWAACEQRVPRAMEYRIATALDADTNELFSDQEVPEARTHPKLKDESGTSEPELGDPPTVG